MDRGASLCGNLLPYDDSLIGKFVWCLLIAYCFQNLSSCSFYPEASEVRENSRFSSVVAKEMDRGASFCANLLPDDHSLIGKSVRCVLV